jgi:hypothetical protein
VRERLKNPGARRGPAAAVFYDRVKAERDELVAEPADVYDKLAAELAKDFRDEKVRELTSRLEQSDREVRAANARLRLHRSSAPS